ncbi:hypothetical protein JZK55_11620 [Dissulfurispira thermophila]|uniref:histidine kinase n=1 Tax=Dissulfurispira thermophila TaxID=2715679 RepID=A0A7G1H0C8_9BACT|nr:ATP-binding protein [Dissulfurispira thermophila]BCB96240.1 hypothetical protein JZK55_11620 [Dissulfurispira thermophila]
MKNIWLSLSIRHKLASIIFLIVIALIIIIFPVTSRIIKLSLLRQQHEHLTSIKNLVIKLFEDYQSKVTNYTRLFSNDRELKDTLFYHTELAGEREHPLRAVERLFSSFDISSIELIDSKGDVVAIAEKPAVFGQNRLSDSLIRRALKGNVASGIELTDKGFLIKASAPVYYNENQIIGVITSGILLDNILLSRIKQLSNTDIVVVDSKETIISSTNADKTEIRNFSELLKDNAQEYIIVEFPLVDMSGYTIGAIKILQENKLPEIIARAHFVFFVLLVIISFVSISILFIALKKMMSPIVKLKEGAAIIGKGEFGYRIPVTTQDEFGELSKSFNSMAQSLENLHIMEERLRQSERFAAVGRFAAGIAHEINNPIGNIIGISKLMLKGELKDRDKDDIETIIKNADRCARITRDLLMYSRQSLPNKEIISVKELVNDSINAVRQKINSKDIEIKTEIADGLTDIYADPLQISQVLNNILMNAVQSIEYSGNITIEVMPLGKDMVDIVVTDTGCGMDEDVRRRVFDPFFTTKAVGEGTGLGLAISYSIVQNHGGELLVESIKGQGSTFVVRLPLRGVDGQTV